MTVRELNRDQLNELKQDYIAASFEDASYSEIAAAADNVPDNVIFFHYANYVFSDDDFMCSCNQ